MKFKKYKFLRLTAAVFVLAAFSALCSGMANLDFMVKWQFAPALLRVFSTAALGSMATLLILILIAVTGGRWYCALWCPVGIFTDLLDLIPFPGKRAVKKDLPFLRFFVLMLALSLAFTGLNAGFLLFDPYSNFARIVSGLTRKSFTIGMLIPLMTAIAVAVIVGKFLGYSWKDLEHSRVQGVSRALPAVFILFLIGTIIGTWIEGGLIPTIIYYGLTAISPAR